MASNLSEFIGEQAFRGSFLTVYLTVHHYTLEGRRGVHKFPPFNTQEFFHVSGQWTPLKALASLIEDVVTRKQTFGRNHELSKALKKYKPLFIALLKVTRIKAFHCKIQSCFYRKCVLEPVEVSSGCRPCSQSSNGRNFSA